MSTFFIRTFLFIAVLGLLFIKMIIDSHVSHFVCNNLVPPED